MGKFNTVSDRAAFESLMKVTHEVIIYETLPRRKCGGALYCPPPSALGSALCSFLQTVPERTTVAQELIFVLPPAMRVTMLCHIQKKKIVLSLHCLPTAQNLFSSEQEAEAAVANQEKNRNAPVMAAKKESPAQGPKKSYALGAWAQRLTGPSAVVVENKAPTMPKIPVRA